MTAHTPTGPIRTTTADPVDAVESFEQERLALFRRRGFDATGDRVEDRSGRRTYVIRRRGGSPPVVLVHGGLSEASEWALLAGRLAGDVVIPDRPGCGLSYPVDYRGTDYRREAAEWFLDLLDGIGAGEPVDLVGNSMGGFFSLAFAAAYPERVRRLVLVGAPAGLDRKLPLFIRLWGNPVTGPLITRKKFRDAEELRRQVFARLLVTRPEDVPAELLEVMLAGRALPGVDRAGYTMLRRVTTLGGWRPRFAMREELARLPVPTLLLWGDSDAFAPPSSGVEVAARNPHVEMQVLPGTGHLPHIDCPEPVADAVLRFLDRDGGM